jgi:ribosomal protein S18 acetylase RimI-like enzyme
MWCIPQVHTLALLWKVSLILCVAYSGIAWVPGTPFSFRTTSHAVFLQPFNAKQSSMAGKVPSGTLEDGIPDKFPWDIELEPSSPRNQENATPKALTIRPMQAEDLDAIVEMCIQEYGTGPVEFPLWNPLLLGAWLDRQYLSWLVEASCLVKLLLCDFTREDSIADDHVILVAALNDDSDGSPIIVGMIEISQQPVEPQRTPSPFPLPLGIKKAVASISTGKYELVGWITNLLIAPPHRGQGYSKALVEACEAVAMSWHCSSIHLHCDADRTTGYVPQKLYHRLGYRSPTLSSHSSPQTPLPYIVEIEGVPLLYLRKSLLDAR